MRRDLFESAGPFEEREFEGHRFRLPILYRRFDCFFAIFSADRREAERLLPSNRLRPVLVSPGRVALQFTAFNYLDTDIGPYGEFSVAIPCIVRHQGRRLLGLYIHRLPVTTEIARVGGIEFWGYPKFICKMEFESTSLRHRVKLSSAEGMILDLQADKPRFGLSLAREVNSFTVKDGELIFTSLKLSAHVRVEVRGMAALATGPHWMGEELARLKLGDRPLAAGDFLDARMALPLGVSIGPV